MNVVDIALIVFLIVGAISGYREGFLMELFSLIAILLGILGAFKLLGWAMLVLAESFDIDQKILPYVAFGVVFVAIVIAVRLLGGLIKLSIDRTFLGRVDQAAGSFLGIIKTTFLLSVAIWIVDSLRISLPENWTKESWLFPMVAGFAPLVTSWIAEIFPVFNDVF